MSRLSNFVSIDSADMSLRSQEYDISRHSIFVQGDRKDTSSLMLHLDKLRDVRLVQPDRKDTSFALQQVKLRVCNLTHAPNTDKSLALKQDSNWRVFNWAKPARTDMSEMLLHRVMLRLLRLVQDASTDMSLIRGQSDISRDLNPTQYFTRKETFVMLLQFLKWIDATKGQYGTLMSALAQLFSVNLLVTASTSFIHSLLVMRNSLRILLHRGSMCNTSPSDMFI